ncbi:peptidylprolyl isomerase [Solibaculum intestinale]|uniref:Peptidyl-prolyl cis-trans isomerase n=1 Tax=Solibaculum intestinale TaxID=3133165 RepID=A0ABV1E2P6_9FIRM
MKPAFRIRLCSLMLCLVLAALSGCSEQPLPQGDDAFRQMHSAQFALPEKGEQIAVVTTSLGVIKIRLFGEEAPAAVENFIGLAKSGFYNGQKFYRVIPDSLIVSGDAKDENQSFWGKKIELETSKELHHFRGALGYYHDDEVRGNYSEFYIIKGDEVNDAMAEEMKAAGSQKFSDGVISDYRRIGGFPDMDYNYTVFGQVFEGIEVVDAIAAAQLVENPPYDNEYTLPAENIWIESVEIVEYEG